MALIELRDLTLDPARPALLGLDVGEKTIGVAASDRTRTIASPKLVIARSKFTADADAVFKILDEYEAGGLIIGLPLHMNGQMSPRAQAARSFARNLIKIRDLPIVLWDERMTTMAAERALLEADMSRAKRATRIDATAAALILQGVLEYFGQPL